LAWDAYRFAKDQRAEKFKQELITLLDFLNLGLRLLSSVSEDDAKIRDGIGDAVRNLAIQVARDQDYFGQPENVVPLGPPKKELTEFTGSLANLKEQEEVYFDYLDALREGNELGTVREKALDAAKGAIGELQNTHDALRTTLIGFVGDRNKKGLTEEAQIAVENARWALESKLQGLQDWVKTCSGLTTDDYLNCVFNLAFCGSPITENAAGKTALSGHGVFTGITTLTSQVGNLITKAVETLPNDEGQPVRREHLLKQVDKFSKKLDNLKEAWTTIKNARHPSDPAMVQLDDKDAYRLLVAQKDFDTLLDQFSTNPKAEVAMAAMDAYVDAVQERNAVLGEYNALVAEYLRVAGEIRAGELHRDSVQQSISQGAQPNAQAEMAFITALYNRARERCIAYYYLASCAYRFWSLESDDSLYKTLKLGSINQIDYKTLKDAEQNLFTNRVNTIQAILQNPEAHFPPEEADYEGGGVIFAIKPGYALRLMAAAGINEIPNTGRETVIVALVGKDNLHIRIFDEAGTKVIDKAEPELLQSEALLALKNALVVAIEAGDWEMNQKLDLIGDAVSFLTGSSTKLQNPSAYRLQLRLDYSTFPDKDLREYGYPVDELSAAGSTIIVGVLGSDKFRLRIFDKDGNKVVEELLERRSPAPGVRQSRPFLDLKNMLAPGPPRRYFPDLIEHEIVKKASLLAGYPAGPTYLTMMVISSAEDIIQQAANKVVVAFIRQTLHIRIFDHSGKRVIDKAEPELTQNQPLLSEVKRLSESVLSTFFLEPKAQQELIHALLLDYPFGQSSLSLAAVPTLAAMRDEGRNTVILGLVGESLHIRIFDAAGNKVVDVGESKILTDRGTDARCRQHLSFLKNLLLLRKTPQEALFENLRQRRGQEILAAAAQVAGFTLPSGCYYPGEFAELKKNGRATFLIPAPTPGSSVDDNPFAPYYNVRLTRVRAWISGVKTGDSMVLVNLTHKGPELIRALDKSLVPFVHKDVSFPFKYNWKKVKWDEDTHQVANVAEVLLSESDLRVKIEGDDTEYLEMIGPFAEWEIAVTDDNNKKPVDRSQIDTIYLDFHGFGQ
jgi:hypothetical protein